MASLLPPLLGGLAIVGTFFLLRLVSTFTDLSVFALNLTTGLGLGLAIDYSLFIVSRYREEATRDGFGLDALRRTLQTAGRTVLFSSVTVAFSVAALTIFPQRFLYSMGIAGAIVALLAATLALTVLPALLAVLGPRVNALSPQRLRPPNATRGPPAAAPALVPPRAVRHQTAGSDRSSERRTADRAWHPVLHADQVHHRRRGGAAPRRKRPPGPDCARGAISAQPHDTARGGRRGVRVLVGSAVARRAARRPAGCVGGRARASGGPRHVAAPGRAGAWSTDRRRRTHSSVTVAIHTPYSSAWPERRVLLDMEHSLGAHLPVALAVVIAATLSSCSVTGSVVLPSRPFIMNALNLSAVFGILVLIFQHGNLQGLLGYHSVGALDATQPILLFAIGFGLATDYGVFLLARIRRPTTPARRTRRQSRWGSSGRAHRHQCRAAVRRRRRGVRDLSRSCSSRNSGSAPHSRCCSTHQSSGLCWSRR